MWTRKRIIENFLKNPDAAVIIILVVISFALRIYSISFQPLWKDEGATYYFSVMPLKELLNVHEFSPPLFYILEHWAMTLFGESELVLRMPSAVAGALSVAAAYLLVDKMFGSKRIALLAAILLMFSPVHILFSQEARMYAVVMLLFLCELYFYLDVLRVGNRRSWLLLVLFAWLAFNFSYYSILPTLLLFIHWMHRNRDSLFDKYRSGLKTVMRYGLLFLLLSSPAIYLMLLSSSGVIEQGAWSVGGIHLTSQILSSFMYRNIVLTPVLLSFAVLGMYMCRKKFPEQYRLMAFIILVSIIVPTILSLFITLAVRHVLFSLTLFYAAIACCLFAARSNSEQKRLFVAGVVGVVILGAVLLPSYYTTPRNDDFRGAAAVLDEETADGDVVMYFPNSTELIYGPLSFYFKKSTVSVSGTETAAEIETNAANALSEGHKVFVVTCSALGELSEKQFAEIMDGLRADGFTVDLLFGHCNVSVYHIY